MIKSQTRQKKPDVISTFGVTRKTTTHDINILASLDTTCDVFRFHVVALST